MLRTEPAVKFLFEELCPKVMSVELVSLRLLTVMVPPPLTVTAVTLVPVGNVIWKVSR